MILKVGDKVRYTDQKTGGGFDATVVRLITAAEFTGRPEMGETVSQAVLMPTSPDVRAYIGRVGDRDAGAYVLGKAHWNDCITLY